MSLWRQNGTLLSVFFCDKIGLALCISLCNVHPAIEEISAGEGLSERQQEWKRGCINSVEINRKAREDCLENPDFPFSKIQVIRCVCPCLCCPACAQDCVCVFLWESKGICPIFKSAMDLSLMLSVAEKTKAFNSGEQYGRWWWGGVAVKIWRGDEC